MNQLDNDEILKSIREETQQECIMLSKTVHSSDAASIQQTYLLLKILDELKSIKLSIDALLGNNNDERKTQ